MRRVICIVGISGVGKTTFINSLKSEIMFQYLSAGSIIKAQRELESQKLQERDTLRHQNIDENQRLLIDGFHNQLDEIQNLILLDGHTVIDTTEGLRAIPSDVFEALGINEFIMLHDSPDVIARRRSADKSRQRPQLSVQTIEEHQNSTIVATAQISRELNIPLLLTSSKLLKDIVIPVLKSV